ncbi:MAG: hypothetical protein ABIR50_00825, partial [Ginsengibacter sp.]
ALIKYKDVQKIMFQIPCKYVSFRKFNEFFGCKKQLIEYGVLSDYNSHERNSFRTICNKLVKFSRNFG